MIQTGDKALNKKHFWNIRECFFFLFHSVASGSLVGLAWREPNFSMLGVLGLGLFFYGHLAQRQLRWRLLQSWIFGYTGFLITNFWMVWTIENTAPISSTKAIVFAHLIHLFHGGMFVCFALLGWLAEKKFRNGWLLLPLAFIVAESIWPSLFPFRQGCLLFSVPALVQSVSIFGVSTATLQIVLLGSLLPLSAAYYRLGNSGLPMNRHQSKCAIVGVLVLTLCNFCWGEYRIRIFNQENSNFSGEHFSALVVQNDTSYATYHVDLMARSREHGEGCDLIVWPECSLGHFDKSLSSFSDHKSLVKLSYGYGIDSVRPLSNPTCHLLAGGFSSTQHSGPDQKRNTTPVRFGIKKVEPKLKSKFVTAFLVDNEESIVGTHDKINLMAGGEYTPAKWLVSKIDGLIEILDVRSGPSGEAIDVGPSNHPLSRGTIAKPIGTIKNVSIGTMLCCEDMYPSISRELTNNGADILICLANAACFNEEAALYQHFLISRFRAIENNRYLLRCGSHGVSALVGPTGEVLERIPCFENQQMKVEIPIKKRQLSLFTQFGSWPLLATFGLGYLSLGRSAWLSHISSFDQQN